jgi:hypothetical protein
MPATYDKIQTYTVTGSAVSTVSFTSISSAYTDLVIVANANETGGYGLWRLNNDAGANYTRTYLLGSGSSTLTSQNLGLNQLYWNGEGGGDSFCTNIIEIFNYASTAAVKSMQQRDGLASQTSILTVMRWNSTAAVNRFDFLSATGTNTIAVGSTFTIYGILRA